MKIVCIHFLGFDGLYKIYGITAFEDNGAIVYGWKKYYDVIHGVGNKNSFTLKIILSISVYPNPMN
jgi:hypothetical protein